MYIHTLANIFYPAPVSQGISGSVDKGSESHTLNNSGNHEICGCGPDAAYHGLASGFIAEGIKTSAVVLSIDLVFTAHNDALSETIFFF